jgi:hypothetical protein
MKPLSFGQACQAGSLPWQRGKAAFRAAGAAASVLVSTMFAPGAPERAPVQGAPLWRADTILAAEACVDPSSGDTLRKLVMTVAYNDLRDGRQESIAAFLISCGSRLDARGREALLAGNLRIGTLPATVFTAAKELGVPDTAMRRLYESVYGHGRSMP